MAKAINNNAQVAEVEKCSEVIGDDVMIDVDPTDDDQFKNIDGVIDPTTYEDEQIDDEELDYDSGDLDPIDDEQLDRSTETIEVDSVINFRQKKKDGNTQETPVPITFASPEELQKYVQGVLDAKWEERESQLVEKQNATPKPRQGNKNHSQLTEKIKSPSDTTLYAPALQKTPDRNNVNMLNGLRGNLDSLTMDNDQDTDAMQRIANFVDNMRFADDERRQREGVETTKRVRSEVVVPPKLVDHPLDDGRGACTSEGRGEIAAKMILDAEKFRGEVAKPQGMDNFPHFFSGVQKISEQKVIDDDEFFHVTCHVDK